MPKSTTRDQLALCTCCPALPGAREDQPQDGANGFHDDAPEGNGREERRRRWTRSPPATTTRGTRGAQLTRPERAMLESAIALGFPPGPRRAESPGEGTEVVSVEPKARADDGTVLSMAELWENPTRAKEGLAAGRARAALPTTGKSHTMRVCAALISKPGTPIAEATVIADPRHVGPRPSRGVIADGYGRGPEHPGGRRCERATRRAQRAGRRGPRNRGAHFDARARAHLCPLVPEGQSYQRCESTARPPSSSHADVAARALLQSRRKREVIRQNRWRLMLLRWPNGPVAGSLPGVLGALQVARLHGFHELAGHSVQRLTQHTPAMAARGVGVAAERDPRFASLPLEARRFERALRAPSAPSPGRSRRSGASAAFAAHRVRTLSAQREPKRFGVHFDRLLPQAHGPASFER